MPQVQKIDSNVTGLRYAEEASIKTLPGSPVWILLEPNSYDDFGGELTTLARNPINADRQRSKGVVTDLDASGGFPTDLTQDNMQDLLQGFFFASLRRKGEALNAPGVTTLTISVTSATDTYTRVGGTLDLTTQFSPEDLVYITGSAFANNNGLKRIDSVTATTVVTTLADGAQTADTTTDEGASSAISIVQVGAEGGAGDVDVDDTGSFPALTSTVLDFTTMGLVVGEWVWIGGDVALTALLTAANNTLARVRTIAATRLEFDKTDTTMVTEANAAQTVHIYTGRVLKNELGATILRRTYQLERTLGAPDSDLPAEIQAEYLVGAVPGELTINVGTADKVTFGLSFVATDNEQIDGPTALKSGARPALVDADAFNTSSDVKRIKVAIHSDTDANPTALFGFATELTLTINNNLSPNKAIGVLGAFDVTAGTFQVGGNATAYFSNVSGPTAVRNNADVTVDMFIVKANAGMVFDLPLIAPGDGRLNVVQDEPITLPLTLEAARGRKIATGLDHTFLMTFFDFLPTLAD